MSDIAHPLDTKLTAALTQVYEVFRVSLWDAAKESGLTPLQIQTLLTLFLHGEAGLRLTEMALQLNITKPTLSDAVKVLVQKGLIEKMKTPSDARSTLLFLTPDGREKALHCAQFSQAIQSTIATFTEDKKAALLETLLDLIFKLQQAGIISMTKLCFSCQHYHLQDQQHYCRLLDSPLAPSELKVHCPEHVMRTPTSLKESVCS